MGMNDKLFGIDVSQSVDAYDVSESKVYQNERQNERNDKAVGLRMESDKQVNPPSVARPSRITKPVIKQVRDRPEIVINEQTRDFGQKGK